MVSRTRTMRRAASRAQRAAQRAAQLRAADVRTALIRTADAYARQDDAASARGVLLAIPRGVAIPAIEVNTCKIDEDPPSNPTSPRPRGTRG